MPCSALDGAALPLEGEGPGDDADRQRAKRSSDAGDHRRTTGACTATLARSDEDHVGALQSVLDVLCMVFGRLVPLVRIRPGTKTASQIPADVELHVRIAHQQRLRVGIDRDELDTPEPRFDHAVDRIDAAAADADDLDDRQVIL